MFGTQDLCGDLVEIPVIQAATEAHSVRRWLVLLPLEVELHPHVHVCAKETFFPPCGGTSKGALGDLRIAP